MVTMTTKKDFSMNLKTLILNKYLVLILCSLVIGCTSQEINKVPLFIEKEKRAIIVPVKFGDVNAPYMLFDSGFNFDLIMLDSTFCANNTVFFWTTPDQVRASNPSAWENSNNQQKVQYAFFNKPISINLCDENFDFKPCFVRDMSTMAVNFLNGAFGFTKDSTRIWELNFEHNYLDIHKADNFKLPSDCYKLPLLKGPTNGPFVQFPILVKCSNGDTVIIDELYLFDTAALNDIILLNKTNQNTLDFFRKRDDAVLIADRGSYRSRYIVEAEIFDGIKIDSMRVYTNEYSDLMVEAGVIGLNFMKRFNLFFDFKTNQVGFQPIKSYERIVDYNYRRFYYSLDIKVDKRQFIKNIANIKNNYYKDAGLQEGDEIVSINGFAMVNLTREEGRYIEESRIREMDILRNGKSLKITVHLGEEAFYE